MRDPDPRGLLTAAQARVSAVRALLARPRACNADECITLFREAQGYLEWLRDSLPQTGTADSGLRHQTLALAGEIRVAGILLDQAAHYGRRWLERLLPVPAGYTRSGDRPPQEVCGHVSFVG